MVKHAPIPVSTIGVLRLHNPEQHVVRNIDRFINDELRALHQGLANPRGRPKEHPSDPVPIAAKPYFAALTTSAQGARKRKGLLKVKKLVAPGRLRRAVATGFSYGGWRASLSPNGITVKWGVPNAAFGGIYLNYAGYVAQMPGVATGGGTRYHWDRRMRKYLYQRLQQIVKKTNQRFRLTSATGVYLSKS